MEEFSSADILEKQNRKKKLAFLGVGLFEISFVLIIIIVLFGMLNYFNILSLSTLYPNQLAFLPHQQITSKQLPKVLEPTPITDIQLAEITKQQGIAAMVKNGYPISKQWPYGYSMTFQNATIVALEKDEKNNFLWMALAFPGDTIERSDENQTVTNLDGTKTKLYSYTGFTAWVKLTDYIIVTGNDNVGQQGLKYANRFLKVGDVMKLTTISINQSKDFKQNQKMNLDGIAELDKNVGKPNNKLVKEFMFVAETIYVNVVFR